MNYIASIASHVKSNSRRCVMRDYEFQNELELQEYFLQIACVLYFGALREQRKEYLTEITAALGLSNEFKRMIGEH